MRIGAILRVGVGLGLIIGLFAGLACSEPQTGPKICTFEHECKEGERCIFDDPNCTALTGQCKGKCIAQEPIPEVQCDCRDDLDCKAPIEGCVSCKCVKRDVLPCESDKDCIQGWYCVGDTGRKICEPRTTCSTDDQCPPNFKCRDNSCCDPETNRCPGTCEEGTACEEDLDCFFCNMRCVEKKCKFVTGDACEGKKCTQDDECTGCNGSCLAGYCKQQ